MNDGRTINEKAAGQCSRFFLRLILYEFVSRLCRYAGILNLKVQGGYSQFNFGIIGLATRTPIEQMSVTCAHKWFKELWHSRTRQEVFSLRQISAKSNGLRVFVTWCRCIS
jgi:hypothetical protein